VDPTAQVIEPKLKELNSQGFGMVACGILMSGSHSTIGGKAIESHQEPMLRIYLTKERPLND
jgi:hypothetical protein